MKKVLTLLFSLVTITAMAQQPQRAYKHPIPNASSAYSFKTFIADSAIGLPRYPVQLSAAQIKYLGRQNDALMFADTLAGIVYWYNPHEDAVKVLGGSGGSGSADLSNYYNKTQSDSRYLQTYIESDPTFLASAANGITGTNVTNWNTAYSWGNHAGLYKLISYVPAWSEITGKPALFSGSYIDLTNKPDLSVYATVTSLNSYLLKSDTAGMLSPYLRTNVAAATYQPKGSYLTAYTEGDPLALKISNNLSDLTNAATARTNLGLGSLATKSSLATSDIPDISVTYATQAQLTTTNSNVSSNTTALAGKQATLVSGTNIKTINGTTILGSGNINAGNALYLGSYTKANRDAIASPAAGSQIFNTDDGWYEYYDAFWGWMPMAITNEWRKKYGWEYFNDFLNSANDGVLSSSSANSGGVNTSIVSSGNNASNVTLSIPTTATARAGYLSSATAVMFGSGLTVYESLININALSNSTDRYAFFAGFFDVISAVDQTDGVYLLYDEGGVTAGSTASGNWQLVTSSNSVRTFITSSVAVAASTWYNIRIEVNAAGTLATFYVNGTSIGTISTNIPVNSSSRLVGFGANAIKSIGTTNRTIQIDYISCKQKFTTAR